MDETKALMNPWAYDIIATMGEACLKVRHDWQSRVQESLGDTLIGQTLKTTQGFPSLFWEHRYD